MISAAIIGGSGYTGKYIVKFCNEHPNIHSFEVYAKKSAGTNLVDTFPELEGTITDQIIKDIANLDFNHDIYFLALPHGESLKHIPQLISNNKKVIDLGADFRLDSGEKFLSTYHQ